MPFSEPRLLSVGHSNHALDRFVALLRGAGVACVADVRSSPVSRFVPWFNRTALTASLRDAGIGYRFLGDRLGGKPKAPPTGHTGTMYDAIAATQPFRTGLAELLELAAEVPTATMCAERSPLDCHRMMLVARHAAPTGVAMAHILADGAVEPHAGTERRLIDWHRARVGELLTTTDPDAERAEAYDARSAWMTTPKRR